MEQTKTLVNMDSGAFLAAFTYDDVSLRILSIHVENNTEGRSYFVSAEATATGRRYSLTIPPGIIDQAVPQDLVNRLQLSVTPSGKLDGVQWSVS